jgi:1-acyl-sn-glycerol-3-phosphate acyltransferase
MTRLVTIPAYLVAAMLVWAALPVLICAALLIDAVSRRPLLITRLTLLLAVYLACEVAGLIAAGGLWLLNLSPRLGRDRWLDMHWRLQAWWAGTIFGAIRRLLRFDVSVEGAELATPGPVLVFIRHASIMDTLLPSMLVGPSGLHLRYVLKKELQWDPCLDIVGNRLPNVFIDRESPDSRAEIALVCDLAHEMGTSDGILIYPEGTRFTPAKRERALGRLSSGDPGLLRRARALQHVLPPKLGGPLGLLDANPEADVLFIAHVGLDGLARVRHLWDRSLVGRRIQVGLWRIHRDRIPADRSKRVDWLFDEWSRVDRWIADRREAGS